MIKTLSTEQAINDLLSDQYAGWTYDEAETLVDWYEQLEQDTGTPIEFDRVAIRCEWASSTPEQFCNDYGIHKDEMIATLEDNTYYFELSNGNILYQQF